MNSSIQLDQASAQEAKATAADVNAKERATPSRGIAIKVGGHTNRVVYSGGNLTSSTDTAIAKGTNAPVTQVDMPSRPDNSGAVTGKSINGRTISGDELQRSSVITVGGMDTSVAAAASAGLIAKNASGQWTWTDKARALGHTSTERATSATQEPQRPGPQEQQQQNQQPPAFEKLDNEGESLLQHFNQKVPGQEFQGAVREVIASNGQLSPEVIDLAAKHLGVPQEEAATKAEALRASFQRQADAAIGSHAQAVYAWGWQNSPEEMRTLTNEFIRSGKTDGLKSLASRYMEGLDLHDPSAILNSEDGQKLKARLEPSGRISIEHPKAGRVLWSAAVKAGLFKTQFR